MGLDITYVKLGKKIDVDGEDDQPLSINYDNLLRLNNDYDWEQSDDIEGGYYEYESIGEFRAGSYSAYAYFKSYRKNIKTPNRLRLSLILLIRMGLSVRGLQVS